MPYWIQSTLAATPALLWMFAGVGLPWALVALPRRDWRDRIMVACLTLAFGPALVTAWMFVLGSVQGANLLRLEWVLGGTGVIAAVGWVLVWVIRTPPPSPLPVHKEGEQNQAIEPPRRQERDGNTEDDVGGRGAALSLRFDERLLVGLVAIALVIRWIGVAYWPTTAYDALWVYGYEGRLYTLLGHIPTSIEYYPQFLPLQHTFLQLAVGGIDDHAARAVLPWLHIGSILAVYVMGNRLFSRRVGIFAAAIWALYPHMGEWSRYGDLEVPVTFMFTGAVAFFVMALEKQLSVTTYQLSARPSITTNNATYNMRYAVIAGLFLGIGLWTKPTMGAFVWGMALVGVAGIWGWRAKRGGGSASSYR
ncbi:MAG: glycosyltransferase family 39 protein [Anaerolineae bacterium]